MDAAVSVQLGFKERFGYELSTDEAQTSVRTIQPYAQVIGDLYSRGRDAAVLVHGDALVTAVEVVRLEQSNRAFDALKKKFFCADCRKHVGSNYEGVGLLFQPPQKAKSPMNPPKL